MTVRVQLYGTPRVPDKHPEGMAIAGAVLEELTVKVTPEAPVPIALVAVTVTKKGPAIVGMPEITPVAAFTVRPGGNPIAP